MGPGFRRTRPRRRPRSVADVESILWAGLGKALCPGGTK